MFAKVMVLEYYSSGIFGTPGLISKSRASTLKFVQATNAWAGLQDEVDEFTKEGYRHIQTGSICFHSSPDSALSVFLHQLWLNQKECGTVLLRSAILKFKLSFISRLPNWKLSFFCPKLI